MTYLRKTPKFLREHGAVLSRVGRCLLTPSSVSCHGSRLLSGHWWTASWSRRAVWPLPRTCPDRRDPLQTELVLPFCERGQRQ